MRMWARLRYGWLHDRPGSGGLALLLADAWRRAVEDRLDRLDLGTATTHMAVGPSLSIVHVEASTEAAVPVALALVDGLLDLPRWLDLDDLPSAETTPPVRWRRAFDRIPPPERVERPEHELLPALVRRLIGRPQLALGLRAADITDDDARVLLDWTRDRLPPGRTWPQPTDPGWQAGGRVGEGEAFVVGGDWPTDACPADVAAIARAFAEGTGRSTDWVVDDDPAAPRWFVQGRCRDPSLLDRVLVDLVRHGPDPSHLAVTPVIPPPSLADPDPQPSTVPADACRIRHLLARCSCLLYEAAD